MPDGNLLPISKAKGRPMLTWVGKRPLRQVTAYPAQGVETFAPHPKWEPDPATWADWPDGYPPGGLLFHGDNKDVLAHLLANGFRGKVQLVYIDPPFDSGADYVRKVSLRGITGQAKLDGEGYALGEQIQYTDIWANDSYLQFMYERLQLMRELLANEGSIILHCDYRRAHYLRVVMDEVFGEEFFRANIVWRSMTSSGFKGKSSLGRSHADLLYYTAGGNYAYHPMYVPYDEDYLRRFNKQDADGRWFKDEKIGTATTQETIELYRAGDRLYVTSTGGLRIKHYRDEALGLPVDDVWSDIAGENSQSTDLTDYPTQKPSQLAERVIQMFSNVGDVVLDCFVGSGTSAAVAQKMGRRWIAADINKGAIQTTAKRLMTVIEQQWQQLARSSVRPRLLAPGDGDDTEESPSPPQLSFAVYRVNDFDLQIQHIEAVELACNFIGITRTRSDPFFDGTLGRNLVRIVPFGHPLTPLDFEEIKRELAARPDETRDVTVVCLGKEIAVDAWLEDWNALRRKGDVPNKMSVIELRTDPKYGGFFAHQPVDARVSVAREGDRIRVKIDDFISPTVVERLKQQVGIVTPHIDDWRSMVDSVMIDTAYDGQVFNVALADVPEKKNDLVAGEYEIPVPAGPTTVAVRITDMLGEEVLKTSRL